MTFTPLTGPGRITQFLWGARTQNTLTFSYPAVLDAAKFWRQPRLGSEQVVMNNLAESWTTARDYYAEFNARWLQLTFYAGHAGFQAFLDWGTAGNPFTLVPDAVNAPLFALPGCLLVSPIDATAPTMEIDGSQNVDLVIRNPTYDLGLAWR